MTEAIDIDISEDSVKFLETTQISDSIIRFMDKVCKKFKVSLNYWSSSNDDRWVRCSFEPGIDRSDDKAFDEYEEFCQKLAKETKP